MRGARGREVKKGSEIKNQGRTHISPLPSSHSHHPSPSPLSSLLSSYFPSPSFHSSLSSHFSPHFFPLALSSSHLFPSLIIPSPLPLPLTHFLTSYVTPFRTLPFSPPLNSPFSLSLTPPPSALPLFPFLMYPFTSLFTLFPHSSLSLFPLLSSHLTPHSSLTHPLSFTPPPHNHSSPSPLHFLPNLVTPFSSAVHRCSPGTKDGERGGGRDGLGREERGGGWGERG